MEQSPSRIFSQGEFGLAENEYLERGSGDSRFGLDVSEGQNLPDRMAVGNRCCRADHRSVEQDGFAAVSVEKNLEAADDFTRPFQEAMTAWCWGFGWVDDTIDAKTRSMMNLSMIGIYCGVPQALECFRVAREVLEETGQIHGNSD